jgi:hypothetical protein
LAELDWQLQQLQHLDLPFSEIEIAATVKAMHKEKAPGPDGFIGSFFKRYWNLIKDGILVDLNQFYNMNQQGLHYLNQAMVVLIPKNPQPKKITGF